MFKFLARHTFIALGIIVFIAVFLRFYNVAQNPPSLTWDEAAWGYNAYTLGEVGKDEFGSFLPVKYIESFGDFKPPFYAYLSVLPVKIFGLNEFSTRFASAFLGSLTVFLTYFLTKQLFKDQNSKGYEQTNVIALLAAGVLAISPWHILLSRAAFEANVATFFIVLGVYLFLASRKNGWLVVLSVISFVISMYTFNTARIVSPVLLAALSFAFRKEIYNNFKKEFVTAAVVGGIIFIPLFLFLLTPQAKLRFAEVNIFTDSQVVADANRQIQNDGNTFWSNIIHNRRVGYALLFVQHYFDNLAPDFLFINGDGNPKFSIRSVGQMYIFEIPLFLAGIFFLFKKRQGAWWLVPFWIIVGIIPAATARETPHALRIETTLPMFQILTAYGVYYLAKAVSDIRFGKLIIGAFFLLALGNFLYFLHDYHYHYPRIYSSEWQYGYKDAVEFTEKVKSKYDRIIFTESFGRPYIYALMYGHYSPEEFTKTAVVEREALGFVHVRSFGKYKFVKDVAKYNNSEENYLYIDMPKDIPAGAKIEAEFKRLNGEPALSAYTL